MYRPNILGSFLALCGALSACAAPSAELGPVRFTPAPFMPVSQTSDGRLAPALAVLDVNGDELPDLYVGRANASDLLLLQDRAVGWRLQALADSDPAPTAALAVDVNADFRADLVVARPDGLFVSLNVPGAALQTADRLATFPSEGSGALLSAGDLNADGWTDLVVAQGAPGAAARVQVLLNQGGGHRGRISFRALEPSLEPVCCGAHALQVADLNDDRWQDVLVAGGDAVHVFENRAGEGWFLRTLPGVAAGASVGAADYDADGDLDLLVKGTGDAPKLSLLRNDGDFKFSDVTAAAGLAATRAGAPPTWVDMDSDGLLDVVLSTVHWLRQAQTGRFVLVRFDFAGGAPTAGRPVLTDFDRDGFADQLAVGADGSLGLFRNAHGSHHWVAVRLRGHAERSTLGARVRLKTQDGKTLVRHQLIDSTTPSNNADELLFGIGRRTELASVEIDWPSGSFTRVDAPFINRRIGFIEPAEAGTRQVALRHPLLEAVKQRKQPDLVCR